MATSKKEKGGNNFLVAAWDQAGDMGLYYNVALAIRFLPTKRRGVFLVECAAFRSAPGGKMQRVAKYSCEFPNASYQDIGAALWGAVNQVDKLLLEDNPEKPVRPVYRPDEVLPD